MQVQADDIAHFLDEQRVLRQLEGLAAVGLQGERPPDAADRRRTQPAHAGHRACTPVCGVAGHRFQGGGHDALHIRVRHRTRRAGAGFIQQAVTTGLEKPAAPLSDGHPRRAQLGGHRQVALPRGAGQHDSGAQGQRLGGLRAAHPAFEFLPLHGPELGNRTCVVIGQRLPSVTRTTVADRLSLINNFRFRTLAEIRRKFKIDDEPTREIDDYEDFKTRLTGGAALLRRLLSR